MVRYNLSLTRDDLRTAIVDSNTRSVVKAKILAKSLDVLYCLTLFIRSSCISNSHMPVDNEFNTKFRIIIKGAIIKLQTKYCTSN